MTQDTDIGGPGQSFPHTRLSAVRSLSSPDASTRHRAYETLVACYWKPVYKYLRLKWLAENEEAKDLTQAFFAHALEKKVLARYEPGRAAFRTYLRTCLDSFVMNERKASTRLKRGGDRALLSLDYGAADAELSLQPAAGTEDPDEYFRREWTRSVFEQAVERLRASLAASQKQVPLALFERYDLSQRRADERLTYDDLAREFNLPVTQVTNFLALARREFRRAVMDTLRDLTGSDEEFREEAARLM